MYGYVCGTESETAVMTCGVLRRSRYGVDVRCAADGWRGIRILSLTYGGPVEG